MDFLFIIFEKLFSDLRNGLSIGSKFFIENTGYLYFQNPSFSEIVTFCEGKKVVTIWLSVPILGMTIMRGDSI